MTGRIAAAVLSIALTVLTNGCKEDSSAAAQESGRGSEGGASKQVRTAAAAGRALGESVLVNGTLDAFDRATAGTKVAGRLASISVDLGSPVTRGQVIARIDPTDYRIRLQQSEAALAQARVRLGLSANGADDQVNPTETPTVREASAVLDEARANIERASSLLASGLVSKADYDQVVATGRVAESRYQDALEEIRNRQAVMSQRRADVSLASQQLADTAITASFTGVVQQRQASVGEFLAAGAAVAEIVKIDPLRFRAEIPERDAATVRIGQTVVLSVDGMPGEYRGRVTRLSPTISERTRVLGLEADIPNDGALRAGSFARATITSDGGGELALTVPNEAIITFAGIQKVVVLEDAKAKEKAVTVGRKTAQWTEVLSGLKAGEEVVLSPVNIRNGQPLVKAR